MSGPPPAIHGSIQMMVPAAGLTVEDGTTTVSPVDVIKFTSGATVTQDMTDPLQANVAVTGGGGSRRYAVISDTGISPAAPTCANSNSNQVGFSEAIVDTDGFFDGTIGGGGNTPDTGGFVIPAATGDGMYRFSVTGSLFFPGSLPTSGYLSCAICNGAQPGFGSPGTTTVTLTPTCIAKYFDIASAATGDLVSFLGVYGQFTFSGEMGCHAGDDITLYIRNQYNQTISINHDMAASLQGWVMSIEFLGTATV